MSPASLLPPYWQSLHLHCSGSKWQSVLIRSDLVKYAACCSPLTLSPLLPPSQLTSLIHTFQQSPCQSHSANVYPLNYRYQLSRSLNLEKERRLSSISAAVLLKIFPLHIKLNDIMLRHISSTCWANCCGPGTSGTKTGAVYVSKWMDMVSDRKGGVMNIKWGIAQDWNLIDQKCTECSTCVWISRYEGCISVSIESKKHDRQ
jgi:hypothetical protein